MVVAARNLLLLLVVVLVAALLTAESSLGGVILNNNNDDTLIMDIPSAYSPELGSMLGFAPVTGPVVFVGDLCGDNEVDAAALPPNAIVFFHHVNCDETLALGKLLPLANSLGACVELHGTRAALVGFTKLDADPNDDPPRFAFDPSAIRSRLKYARVHGRAAGLVARLLTDNSTTLLTATVAYTPDPWQQMYLEPQFIIYYVVVVLFFAVYVTQHSLRAVCMLRRQQQARPTATTSLNLQMVMMCVALALGLMRSVEYVLAMMRDYGAVWTPEVVTQLTWGYGYIILLSSMFLLVLYWRDVLTKSTVNMVFLHRLSIRIFYAALVPVTLLLTILLVLAVYQVPGAEWLRGSGTILLGMIALVESVSIIFIGGQLLKQLTDVSPISQRGNNSPRLQQHSNNQHSNNQLRPAADSTFSLDGSKQATNNPSFSPTAALRKALVKLPAAVVGGGGGSSRQNLHTGSDDAHRAAKEAKRRAKPLTRLVVVSAAMLFCAVIISFVTTFSYVMQSPRTYLIVFALLAACEIAIYALVLKTLSPIWQARRKRWQQQREKEEPHLSRLKSGNGDELLATAA